jgi:hypothetical protein
MKTLSGKTLSEIAIERLKTFEPEEGYWVAYSGGKDKDMQKLQVELKAKDERIELALKELAHIEGEKNPTEMRIEKALKGE